MSDTAIKAENISKVFKKGAVKSIWNSLFKKQNNNDAFYALKDISFEVKKGETLGIIGPNGAGKSTLLKVLCGVTDPTTGSLTIKGKVAPLIEVGAGFHPELTGRENIYLNGIIMGLSKKEVDRKYKNIVDFAELWDFIDTPVKKYSSGMFVRLGFSVAVHTEPDILLVDEVLSVGDLSFKRKCLDRIDVLRERGTTIIFVSHDLRIVDGLCPQVAYIENGSIVFLGDSNKAIRIYQSVQNKKLAASGRIFNNNENRNGLDKTDTFPVDFMAPTSDSGEVEIISVDLYDKKGELKTHFTSEEKMSVKVCYFAKKKINNPVFFYGIYRDDGVCCCGDRSIYNGIKIDAIEGKGVFKLEFEKVQLTSGAYIFGIAIFDAYMAFPYGYKRMGKFTVESILPNMGKSSPIFIPNAKWEMNNMNEF